MHLILRRSPPNRFLPDLGHLEIDVTANDPGAFTAPWKRHLIATIAAKDEEIEEYICSEDNIDPEHLK